MPSKRRAAVASFKCAYYGYKLFQAARACTGDVTVLGELFVEAVQGIAGLEVVGFIAETTLGNTAEIKDAVGDLAGDLEELHDTAKDFSKFAKKFNEALGKGNILKGQGMMNEAQRVFASFNECDTDGNGVISRNEFIRFYAKFGFSRTEALKYFYRADNDGNGGHGLKVWQTKSSYYICVWCNLAIPDKRTALECRQCDCHACLNCTEKYTNRQSYLRHAYKGPGPHEPKIQWIAYAFTSDKYQECVQWPTERLRCNTCLFDVCLDYIASSPRLL